MLLVVNSINSFVVKFSRRLESCLRVTASVALPQNKYQSWRIRFERTIQIETQRIPMTSLVFFSREPYIAAMTILRSELIMW